MFGLSRSLRAEEGGDCEAVVQVYQNYGGDGRSQGQGLLRNRLLDESNVRILATPTPVVGNLSQGVQQNLRNPRRVPPVVPPKRKPLTARRSGKKRKRGLVSRFQASREEEPSGDIQANGRNQDGLLKRVRDHPYGLNALLNQASRSRFPESECGTSRGPSVEDLDSDDVGTTRLVNSEQSPQPAEDNEDGGNTRAQGPDSNHEAPQQDDESSEEGIRRCEQPVYWHFPLRPLRMDPIDVLVVKLKKLFDRHGENLILEPLRMSNCGTGWPAEVRAWDSQPAWKLKFTKNPTLAYTTREFATIRCDIELILEGYLPQLARFSHVYVRELKKLGFKVWDGIGSGLCCPKYIDDPTLPIIYRVLDKARELHKRRVRNVERQMVHGFPRSIYKWIICWMRFGGTRTNPDTYKHHWNVLAVRPGPHCFAQKKSDACKNPRALLSRFVCISDFATEYAAAVRVDLDLIASGLVGNRFESSTLNFPELWDNYIDGLEQVRGDKRGLSCTDCGAEFSSLTLLSEHLLEARHGVIFDKLKMSELEVQ